MDDMTSHSNNGSLSLMSSFEQRRAHEVTQVSTYRPTGHGRPAQERIFTQEAGLRHGTSLPYLVEKWQVSNERRGLGVSDAQLLQA